VPEKGATANSFFRATNDPVGAVDPTNPERVVVTFGSYINRHSNEDNGCVPAGFSEDTGNPLYEGVKTVGACNNDILISVSHNAGASFTGGDTDVRDLPSATSAPGSGPPTSGSSGPPSPATASWPPPTTTASTGTTNAPAGPTSACPAPAACGTSGSSG
jgi:hypothetical protein